MKIPFLKRRRALDVQSVESQLLTAILGGESVDRNNAKSLPAVSASVDLICNLFARIPFKLYEETVNEKGRRVVTELDDIRVERINGETGDTLSGFEMKKAICEDYLLDTGGYIYINRHDNQVFSLHYVVNSRVSIEKNTDPIFKDFKVLVNGNKYDEFEFIKLLRNTKDGAKGEALTSEIASALRSALQRLIYDYELAATGGSRKGFLKVDKKISKDAAKQLKEDWENYYSGRANTVLLNEGVSFQEASNTSRESEIDAKEHTFTDNIKSIFHIEATLNDTIKAALEPIAAAFAAALNRDLLLESEKSTLYFAPDMKELYKGTMLERFQAYQIAIDKGFKTRNEIRYLEDDNFIDGLDTVNLGLGDVLLDVESGQIYVPNTGETYKLGESKPTQAAESPQTSDIDEGIS